MPVPRDTPSLSDEVTLSRYPFLPQASSWIRNMALEHDINLEELLDGEWMEKARQRARIRLVDSVQSKEGVEIVGGDIHTEEGKLIEAFSFYYARLVVCASEDERLIARWAQAEAARAEQILAKDTVNLEKIAKTYINEIKFELNNNNSHNPGSVSSGLQTIRQNSDGKIWKIGLVDFIEICPKITGNRWRLANSDIQDGWITLFDEHQYSSSSKVARLLRERIKISIEKDALEKMEEITTDLAIRLAEPVGMVRNLMANKASEAIALVGAEESDWPPCMRNTVMDLQKGVNVNHFGRLFLASMSATLALPVESCVGFFSGAPDFNESTTNYQVKHVYEHAYTPAKCASLKVNHNCPVLPGDDRLCDQPWLDHPLKYIRATQRWKAKNKAAEDKITAEQGVTNAEAEKETKTSSEENKLKKS
jgi:DNA primase large subunit